MRRCRTALAKRYKKLSYRQLVALSSITDLPIEYDSKNNFSHMTFDRCNRLRTLPHKNVSNFAMMLYYSTIEFKQKKITFLKSSHSWTIWEIMTLHAFVLTVQYAKKSIGYKITNNFNSLTAWDLHPVTAISRKLLNRTSILLSNCIQSFFHCAMDFRTVSMVTSLHLFLITSFRSCRLANGSHRLSYTTSCRISQMQ